MFNRRCQHNDENILTYVTELSRNASHFKFAAAEADNIRDRLFANSHSNKILESLIVESDDLTLADTVRIALNVKRTVSVAERVGA